MPYPASSLYPSSNVYPGFPLIIEPPEPEPTEPSDKHALLDVVVTVNGTELRGVAATAEAFGEELDMTPLGAEYRVLERGPGEAAISVSFFQDFSTVDAVLFPIWASGESATVSVRPFSSAASLTNPPFTIEGRMESYTPLGEGVGEGAVAEVVFKNADPTPFGDRPLLLGV